MKTDRGNDIYKEYQRKKIVKLKDNLQEHFFEVDPSQIYKLYHFTNAEEFILWAQSNQKVTVLKDVDKTIDIAIDLSHMDSKRYLAS